MSKLVDKGFS